ncbi:MAG: ABC transporter permease [Candidatus Binatus sp.]|uniref:ABC transporter permease n=1 Tax=Candidatus Binatus sp. TaxID=2811406 RepID=UPI0027257625|nr:ABC transporter permease [Candidatus Binatus sp.]MDO8431897.1 ABC transporter permease [Candidatus Binatus sp.]
MIERLHQILIKEFIHLFRDRRARFALIIPPLLQMLIFGYAATYEVKHVSTAVLDLDRSQESREFLERFTSSNRFRIRAVLTDQSQIADLIDHRRVVLALQIHPGFAALLRKGETAPVQAILDGTDSNTALIAIGYINQIATKYAADYQLERAGRLIPAAVHFAPRIQLEERPLYNPNLESRWFFVPGVIGTLLLLSVITLTAFALVREREIGTLEQLMVTPIRPAELIIGKTLPFLLVGLGNLMLVSIAGTLWFQIPFRGSPLVLLLGTILFLSSALGVGLLISTLCTTQQQAFSLGFFFVTPAIMLSGFGYPIQSMPQALRLVTYLDPLRFFLIVLRSSFLKGVGLDVLWPQMVAMALLGAGALTLATLRFHKTLD